jgi:tRNA dimethylallyltransferase
MVTAEGPPALHRWLAALDPATAARVHPNDPVRIVRGVEVALASGIPLSRWQARHAFGDAPYEALVLGLAWPTADLDERIRRRANEMVAAGFVDEVRALRASGLGADAPGLAAVGYREILAHVEGRTDLATAVAATVRATRQLAKRQRTWFRREPGVVWHPGGTDAAAIVDAVRAFVAGAR